MDGHRAQTPERDEARLEDLYRHAGLPRLQHIEARVLVEVCHPLTLTHPAAGVALAVSLPEREATGDVLKESLVLLHTSKRNW